MTMTYKVSLIGNKYGKLTVVDFVPRKGTNSYWQCKCDCGNEEYVSVSKPHLVTGHTQSCGCIKRKHGPGYRNGMLTVIKDSGKRTKDQHRILLCECDCGNIIETGTDCIDSGPNISCGCTRQSKGEKIIEDILKENNIIFQKEYSFKDLKSSKGDWLVRFDFAIFDEDNSLKYLIEYDGIQHFKPVGIFGGEVVFKQQQLNDSLKNQFCIEREIPLIRIPYYVDNLNLDMLLPY